MTTVISTYGQDLRGLMQVRFVVLLVLPVRLAPRVPQEHLVQMVRLVRLALPVAQVVQVRLAQQVLLVQ